MMHWNRQDDFVNSWHYSPNGDIAESELLERMRKGKTLILIATRGEEYGTRCVILLVYSELGRT